MLFAMDLVGCLSRRELFLPLAGLPASHAATWEKTPWWSALFGLRRGADAKLAGVGELQATCRIGS